MYIYIFFFFDFKDNFTKIGQVKEFDLTQQLGSCLKITLLGFKSEHFSEHFKNKGEKNRVVI